MQPGESAGAEGAVLRKRADAQRAALDGLRGHGYDVLHDVRWPGRRRANIDHVAIGPAGILVVDTKNWTGKVSVHHGILRQNGSRRDKQVDGVRRAGVDVAALLQPPPALPVIPVLGLAGEHQVPATRCGPVTVVDVGRLPEWVSALPGHLSPSEAHDLARELRSKLPAEKSPWQRERPARRAAAAKASLLKLTFLLVLLLALPTLLHVWSTAGPDLLAALIPTPTPAAAAPPLTPVYASCRELRAANHPGGVASPGAKNTGRKLRLSVAVTTSQKLYAANARLDTDADHIACEVVRKRPHKR
jgi:hypothetical protein